MDKVLTCQTSGSRTLP